MKPQHLRQLLLLFAIGLLQELSGNAQTNLAWESRELSCAITLPISQGWERANPPANILKVAVVNQAEGKSISVYVVDAPADGQNLDSFIPGFKEGYFKQGIPAGQSEEKVQVDGRPAYRLKNIVNAGGTEIHMASTAIIENSKVYQIATTKRGFDPISDPEIRAAIESFRFLTKQPETRAPTTSHVKESSNDPAKNMPILIGKITFYVLVGIVVVFIIVKISRRESGK